MLSAIELQNFKGVGARQRIDFAPLTLLFGANSAGKSTILQALLYLHEILERGTADVDRTELGGDVLELGGFARLVHRHQMGRAIVLRVEFATPGSLEKFGRDLTEFPFPDLDDEIEAAWLELTIQHRTTPSFRGAMVERAAIGVAGTTEPLVWLESVGSLREGEPLYCRINLGHPVLSGQGLELGESWKAISVPEPIWHRAAEADAEGEARIGLDDLLDFADGRPLPLIAIGRSRYSALPPLGEPLQVVVPSETESAEQRATSHHIRTFLEMVVLGTTMQLASYLRDAIYIGPLRAIPPRGFLYERAGRITSWADGLAAWDLLLSDHLSLVDRTNSWLRRLHTECQVVVQQLFDQGADAEDLSEGLVDDRVRRLLLETATGARVLPAEVGAGISQVVPVIIGALQVRPGGLSLIEQPEIHVHPAVQVGFGDLFLDAVTQDGGRRTLVVETHSEHLLLRVMRRLRETAEGRVQEGRKPVLPGDVMVLFVERDSERTIVRQMPLNERGELVKAWPGGFFEEGLNEAF
jgi:ABC-type ATPase involved in cell division